VLEWLTLASAELAGSISDEKLSKLNAALASRTFLAGGSGPSLADLVLFGLLHPAVVSMTCYISVIMLQLVCLNAQRQLSVQRWPAVQTQQVAQAPA
jgi:hypothetical protein